MKRHRMLKAGLSLMLVAGVGVGVTSGAQGEERGQAKPKATYYAGNGSGPGTEVSFAVRGDQVRGALLNARGLRCTGPGGNELRPTGVTSAFNFTGLSEAGEFDEFEYLERDKDESQRVYRSITGTVAGASATGTVRHTVRVGIRPRPGAKQKYCDSGERSWSAKQVSRREWREFRHELAPGTAKPAYFVGGSKDTMLSFVARNGKLRKIFAEAAGPNCSDGGGDSLSTIATSYDPIKVDRIGSFADRQPLHHPKSKRDDAGPQRRSIRGTVESESARGALRIVVRTPRSNPPTRLCDTSKRRWTADRVSRAEWKAYRGGE